ncbi:MAG: carboxymuconolactone decarboxylase family protein [Nitratireductor sp.]|nr:carboxymuconolactone decarboxylase family protein [Nitratireductor sp.]
MAATDWNAFTDQTNARMAALRKEMPDVAPAFGSLAKAAIAPGELDSKTKELIALAIGITARCDGCLAFHAKAAKRHGATRQEIIETIQVALYMGGGPSMIYGAEALAAFDALT